MLSLKNEKQSKVIYSQFIGIDKGTIPSFTTLSVSSRSNKKHKRGE